MFLAVWSGEPAKAELLARRGANPNRRMMLAGFVDVSAMEMAVATRNNEMIRALVHGGVDVNTKNREGLTALSWASMMGLPAQVRELLALGANVNHADTFGMTPLLWASLIDHGSYGSIETLVKAGADVKARTKSGETALALVKKWQQPDAPRALQQAGAPE